MRGLSVPHRLSGPETKSEKVEQCVGIISAPVLVLAVDDLRLLRMQNQLANRKAIRNCAP
jgi:hypothetical protein